LECWIFIRQQCGFIGHWIALAASYWRWPTPDNMRSAENTKPTTKAEIGLGARKIG
jgi:hypothetical protein